MSTTKETVYTTKAEFVKPYTAKDMWALYDVTPKTFRNWIRPFKEKIGKRTSRLYTPKQVEKIFECLGLPSGVVFTEEKN